MKDYDKNKKSSYLKYWDANNLYSWGMSWKLPVNNFESIEYTSQFNEYFIMIFNIPPKTHVLHNNLPFLPERMKIEKVEKFVTNIYYKTNYVILIRNLKQT